jgi:hypothetical protein
VGPCRIKPQDIFRAAAEGAGDRRPAAAAALPNPRYLRLRFLVLETDKKREMADGWAKSIGAPFIKSDELRSRPAALFYVLLYAKSTIPNARHDSQVIF